MKEGRGGRVRRREREGRGGREGEGKEREVNAIVFRQASQH